MPKNPPIERPRTKSYILHLHYRGKGALFDKTLEGLAGRPRYTSNYDVGSGLREVKFRFSSPEEREKVRDMIAGHPVMGQQVSFVEERKEQPVDNEVQTD